MDNIDNKALTLVNLSKILENHRNQGQTIGLCHGVFDLIHIGHIKYLQSAKKLVDILIVTITPDIHVNKGPSRPAFTERLRAEFLAALEVVDYVAINSWPTAIETIELLQPNLYIKGPDYKDLSKDTTGNIQREKDAVEAVGGKLVFTDDETFSSSNLLLRFSDLYSKKQKEAFHQLRSQLNFEEIQQWFEKLQSLRVLVVGETIIDEYAYCDALGKSGKEPVLNMRHLYEESYLGGVLAIARHLKGLGCQTEVLSLLGENREFEDDILKDLEGITCHFFTKENSPTIVKRRYVDQYSRAKLLGIYKINDEEITETKEAEIIAFLQDNIKNYDLVLVGDYGHGFLTQNIIEYITAHANFLALNTQSNSANLGFHTISKYPKADFICIHSGELRQDYRSRFAKTEDLMLDLAQKLQTKRTLITMGKNGLLGFDDDKIETCPAFASKIIDRVGAGDTVLAITSVLSYIDAPLILTLVSGNLAGAFAVSVQGNKSALNSVQILKSLKTLL